MTCQNCKRCRACGRRFISWDLVAGWAVLIASGVASALTIAWMIREAGGRW